MRVVACRFWPWADAADAAFADRSWPVRHVRFGAMAEGMGGRWVRLRHRAARETRAPAGASPGSRTRAAARRAAHYVTPELARAAVAEPADLYIAHNLGALPAAAWAAARHGARLGFDAEDFHRGELRDEPGTAAARALVAAVEDRFLPRCDYVTAASDGIGQAYAQATGVATPTTVLNVFPTSDLDVEIAPEAIAAEVPEGARSLHWFSQTIGSNRGLEDVVRALPDLPDDVVLSLRGGWADGYEAELRGLADRLHVGHRLRALGHCPPDEVVGRAAQHDVGLALKKLAVTQNRDLCVTNKLFTYVLAGSRPSRRARRGSEASRPGSRTRSGFTNRATSRALSRPSRACSAIPAPAPPRGRPGRRTAGTRRRRCSSRSSARRRRRPEGAVAREPGPRRCEVEPTLLALVADRRGRRPVPDRWISYRSLSPPRCLGL